MFKKKPLFIVFEGIEGCGKSYQSKKLYNNLKRLKIPVILTREPGGTPSAEIIRNLILKDYYNFKAKEKFNKYTDTLLYLAARNEHIINKIAPSIKKGKIVISDRYIDSTFAYQVYGKGVNKKFIQNIHKFILMNIKPDITFILKVKYDISKKRLKKRKTKNRYDKFSRSFYIQTQKAFLKIAKNKRNYYVLDASNDTPDLEKKILSIIKNKLKK